MKVVWTTEARERLRDIQQYIAQENPNASRKLILRLGKRAQKLGALPSVGRCVPEYPAGPYREVLERPYRLIYIVDEPQNHVYILSVMHYRQRLPKQPKWGTHKGFG